eukprot:jgi/Astpho2/573/e_gw1.00013.9.1_t
MRSGGLSTCTCRGWTETSHPVWEVAVPLICDELQDAAVCAAACLPVCYVEQHGVLNVEGGCRTAGSALEGQSGGARAASKQDSQDAAHMRHQDRPASNVPSLSSAEGGRNTFMARSRSASLQRHDEGRKRRRHSPSASPPSDAPEAPPAAAPTAAVKGDGKTGGVYIPPFKLAQMLREQEMLNKGGAAYQRLTWDALRKSINGLVNKVNAENIRLLLPEIFAENLERGRGLLCRTLMKSQLASTEFSATFAALVAIINTKLPEVGELLLKRVVWQFRRAFQRNDKPIVMGCLKFIAHLINQQVAHEVLGLQILMMLLDPPTDDGVEAVLQFLADVGATLQEFSSAALRGVIDQIRRIMQEGQGITPRTATVLETWFASYTKAGGFKDDPIPKDLDLVESGDQITHQLELDEEIDREIRRDVFKEDPEYDEHEKQWQAIKREILGEDSEDEEGPEGSGEEEEEDDEDLEETERQQEAQQAIQDQTQTNLVNLRRTIYLTIMSSMDFEESGHKLMKINIGEEHKIEIVVMLIECCSQEKTYIKYYGLLSERFCKLRREYQELFEDSFRKQYSLIHRLETNKLRNVAKLFAHLMYSDGISWGVLSNIRLTEDDTTSSSRIFIKILFQALSEDMGLIELNARLQEPSLQPFFAGIFPKDTAKNMRFSINFFTSIGLGGLTDAMRDYLQNEMPRIAAERQAQAAAAAAAEASSSESDSSSDDDSSSSGSGSSDDSSSSGGSSR